MSGIGVGIADVTVTLFGNKTDDGIQYALAIAVATVAGVGIAAVTVVLRSAGVVVVGTATVRAMVMAIECLPNVRF